MLLGRIKKTINSQNVLWLSFAAANVIITQIWLPSSLHRLTNTTFLDGGLHFNCRPFGYLKK